MTEFRILRNADTGTILLNRMKWCNGLWSRFLGLQWRLNLPEDEGLILVYARESRVETSIHMFFMFFSIATIWIDKNGRVVDKILAKPWRPAYVSKVPAQYTIEARPVLLDRVNIGDRLDFGTKTK